MKYKQNRLVAGGIGLPVALPAKSGNNTIAITGSMLAFCLLALVLFPLPADGLVLDAPTAGEAVCGPCANLPEGDGQTLLSDDALVPWVPGQGPIETGASIAFWIENTPWTAAAVFIRQAAGHEALLAAGDNGIVGSAFEYDTPVFALSAKGYTDATRQKVLRRAAWMIPLGILVLFLTLCAAAVGLVVNDRYLFGELRQNFVRSDNSLSFPRARIEASHFVQLNAKVLMVVIVYAAGNAFLLFMLQECSHPVSRVMDRAGIEAKRLVAVDAREQAPEVESGLGEYDYDAGMLLLLYAAITGYLFIFRPSRHIFRRYKEGLHRRRRFYGDLDRRRAVVRGGD